MTSAQPPAGASNPESLHGLEAAFDASALRERAFRRSLDRWRQGDLLEQTPLLWVAAHGLDVLTGTEAEQTVPGRLPVVTWDEVSSDGALATSERGWSIITSQTCDVAAVGPGARHLTIQVSPVVLGTGRMKPERIDQARKGRVVELFPVPQLPEDGDWFVDLRLSIPVSKAVLATQDPLHGFKHEGQALNFAEAVARKVRRPSVHSIVSDQLVPELTTLVEQALASGQGWPQAVEQLRLEVLVGDRLWPERVRLVVIGHNKLEPADRKDLQNWQKGKSRTLARASRDADYLPNGINLVTSRFTHLGEISVPEYRNTIPLGVEGLSGAFW